MIHYVAVPIETPHPDPKKGELRFRGNEVMLVDLMVFLGMAASKSDARRLIEQGAVRIRTDE